MIHKIPGGCFLEDENDERSDMLMDHERFTGIGVRFGDFLAKSWLPRAPKELQNDVEFP